MTQPQARKILLRAFAALSPKQKERLRWHATKRTPICCGDDAALYTDGKGGG